MKRDWWWLLMIQPADTQPDCLPWSYQNLKTTRQTETNSVDILSILNNCLTKKVKPYWLTGFNIWNVWVHFLGCMLAFKPYRSQSSKTDGTGGEKKQGFTGNLSEIRHFKRKSTQHYSRKQVTKEKKNRRGGSQQGYEREIWWRIRGNYVGFLL